MTEPATLADLKSWFRAFLQSRETSSELDLDRTCGFPHDIVQLPAKYVIERLYILLYTDTIGTMCTEV
eukprot:SAG31_NODE_2978_length_4831_cov_236.467033_3_plen_68_part_00